MLQKNVQVNRKILATPTIQYTLCGVNSVYTAHLHSHIHNVLTIRIMQCPLYILNELKNYTQHDIHGEYTHYTL